jgi:hypothetical protein
MIIKKTGGTMNCPGCDTHGCRGDYEKADCGDGVVAAGVSIG